MVDTEIRQRDFSVDTSPIKAFARPRQFGTTVAVDPDAKHTILHEPNAIASRTSLHPKR